MYVKYGRPIREFWREEMPPFLRSLAVLGLLGLVVAAVYATAGILAVALLFVPLFASQYMFKLLVREKEHVAKQKELSDQYLEMNIGLAVAMVVLLDSKDEYTAQHSAAVAMYCRDMAQALKLPEEEVEALHLAGSAARPGQGRYSRRRAAQDDRARRRGLGLHQAAPREGRRGAVSSCRLPGGGRHRALPPRAPRRQRLPVRHHRASASRS